VSLVGSTTSLPGGTAKYTGYVWVENIARMSILMGDYRDHETQRNHRDSEPEGKIASETI
jgi:hypothetical protein